ncbi:MAG: glycosyltransferase [Deltaproteobacteria bacterium]|nr:glycosyltransferase [Deltaproteobacteria bacterium]
MIQRTTAILFSKDRALQLDATLASFFLHCRDAATLEIIAVCKTSTAQHLQQYERLQAMYPQVAFVNETAFNQQVISYASKNEFVLFLVDDNIFVRDFHVHHAIAALSESQQAVGFSLRLGRNTKFCYSLNRPQSLPAFVPVSSPSENPILSYAWPNAECDFGYPLEVSSSIYRSKDIVPMMKLVPFSNPNNLEGLLAQQLSRVAAALPTLLCFESSVTFCNPVNKVQEAAPDNRAGVAISYSADKLASIFDRQGRVDVRSYSGHVPNACHEEVALEIRFPAISAASSSKPLVSVIIPCYKQAHFLRDAVGSVVAQTYTEWECIIVNDGSPDDTSAVARELIREFSGKNIQLIEKHNEGLAEARNTGISVAKGEWILPLDSDDKFDPTYMEKAVHEVLAHPDTNIVSANLRCFGAKSDILEVFPFSRQQLLQGNMFPYASMYRRELWECFHGYIPIIPFGAEDYNFWVTCSGVLNPRRIAEPLFLYRKHVGSSMVDAVISHQFEVDACLHTCHPDKYPAETLLRDHDVLSLMHVDTFEAISRTIAKFPQYSQPYLWRGLYHEAQGIWRWAQRDFEMAERLAESDDWQPLFRLALLHLELKNLRSARRYAEATLKRCPNFPARATLEKLIC